MNPKTLITAVLLLFAAGGVVAVAIKEFRPVEPPAESEDPDGEPGVAVSVSDGTIVYFFHGQKQCERCINAKAYAEAAVRAAYAEQLDDGRLKWQLVNYDEPENRHFKQKYDAPLPMVVVAKLDNGVDVKHKRLPLMLMKADDKQACLEYVTEGLQEFFAESEGEVQE